MKTEPGALSLIEQAIHLLRRDNSLALTEYYIGSLPFALGLLYFWSDMSRNAMAAWYCGPSAAGLALLFIWMKYWQVRFCHRLLCRLQGRHPGSRPAGKTLTAVARQTWLHATGMVILPLSIIVFLPMAWVYAFYQNLCVLDGDSPENTMGLIRSAWRQSVLWPIQNHFMLGIITLFGSIVLLALGCGLIAIPLLLKWILGIEAVFTLSGVKLLNTTFWAALCAMTYLCIDPIIKCVYVLRCYYGSSLKTGDDLKSALRPFLKAGLAFAAISFFVLPNAPMLHAEPIPAENPATVAYNRDAAQRLDGIIQEVLRQRRFAWRMPKDNAPEPPNQKSWIASVIRWMVDGIEDLLRPIGRWLDSLIKWVVDRLFKLGPYKPGSDSDYRGFTRHMFYGLGAVLFIILALWLRRWPWRNRPLNAGRTAHDGSDEVDLVDESITAVDLPLHRWLALAQDLTAKQDYRCALRALYFSVLSILADRQRVKVARYKSNLDYTRELAQRAHAEPELLAVFSWCIRAFERAWYGTHPVSRSEVDHFMIQQQRIADLVQPAK